MLKMCGKCQRKIVHIFLRLGGFYTKILIPLLCTPGSQPTLLQNDLYIAIILFHLLIFFCIIFELYFRQINLSKVYLIILFSDRSFYICLWNITCSAYLHMVIYQGIIATIFFAVLFRNFGNFLYCLIILV